MTWQHFLHLEIASRVIYLDSKDIGNMFNSTCRSGTPIFEIRILAKFVSHDFLN